MSNSLLRALVDLRDRQVQKSRIQFSNRLSAIDRLTDETDGKQREVVSRWLDVFSTLEKTIDGDIATIVKLEPIYEEMSQIRGIGPMLAAKIIAMVDIEEADSVSALWRYSGYGVGKYWEDEEGKIVAPQVGMKWIKRDELKDEVLVREAEEKVLVRIVVNPKPEWKLVEVRDRPIEGWLLAYNKRLKTTLYLVAQSFLKCGSPYRLFFDNAKLHYTVTHPEWKPAHTRDASMRKMTKMFTSHMWLRWRLLEGLPTRQPYAHEKLGHETYYAPEDFGWGKAVDSE